MYVNNKWNNYIIHAVNPVNWTHFKPQKKIEIKSFIKDKSYNAH